MNVINKKFGKQGMPSPDGRRLERYPRTVDREKFRANYERINWKKDKDVPDVK